MEDRIKRVMADVLGVGVDVIDEGSSPRTIEAWDSLRHMNLILALEEEFGVQFRDAELPEMTEVRRIRDALRELRPAP